MCNLFLIMNMSIDLSNFFEYRHHQTSTSDHRCMLSSRAPTQPGLTGDGSTSACVITDEASSSEEPRYGMVLTKRNLNIKHLKEKSI